MKHFADETLFAFLEGVTPIEAGIGEHVGSCDECAERVAQYRRLLETLADPRLWCDVTPIEPSTVAKAAAFAERVAAEAQTARAICAAVLTGPSAWWPQRLTAEGPDAGTAGMVLELLQHMRARLERVPREGLQVTEMALAIAERLDARAYPPHYADNVRGQALRDHAFVLWFMGRFPEARVFADRSAALFATVPCSYYENARLSLVRSLILRNLGEESEAARLCREAGDTFLRLGERSPYVKARMTEGVILYCIGAVQAALDTWLTIEGDAALPELEAVKLQHNIALCRSDLGHPELAIEPLRNCIAHYELLEMSTEKARSRAVLGRVLLATGHAREAHRILREASRELADLGLVYDSMLAAMEEAEALIALGRAAEVPALCREVIARMTAAGIASHAIPALSYLREVESGEAPVTKVGKVRESLRESQRAFAE